IFLILSGDQLYRMDFRDIVQRHVESGADVTIAGTPVERSLVSDFGLMRLNGEGWIEEFVEKPTDAGVIDNLVLSGSLREAIENPGDRQFCLANMGIYCFTAKTLRKALDNDKDDFGKEIIPGMLKQGKLLSYVYNGYWEDIGTIKAFFDANLRLTDDVPPFNFFDSMNPVFTRARYLAASKINACKMSRVILSDGCILSNTEFSHCVIGVRSVVRRGTSVRDSILMGADLFETNEDRQENRSLGRPDVGIGENCEIEYAIIDKNVRIGNNVRLSPRGKPDMWEAKGIMVRDGVLIVTKNSIIPDGTVVWDEAESKA
ncbi:MAG: sugar phosphate nucleotidyltransferase, partial [Verrucomicrobiota bacterium]